MRLGSFVALLIGILLPGCSSGPSEEIALGDQLLIEGKAEEALGHYQAAVEQDPDDLDARLRIARVHLALGREAEARAALDEAVLRADAERARVLVRGAEVLLDAGASQVALGWLQERAGPDAQDPEVLAMRGRAELDLGRIAEAVATFESAAGDRTDPRRLALLGTSYYLAGLQELARAARGSDQAEIEASRRRAASHLSEAKNALQEALYLDPSNASVHLSLGQLHHQAGRFEEAMLEYRLARRLAPGNPEPALVMGGVHFEQGRYEEALADLEEARRLGAAERASFFLGMTYWAMKRPAESMGAFGQALAAHPELERQVLAWMAQRRSENVPALIDLVDSEDAQVAAGSVRLLRGLSGQDLGGDEAAWREWWTSQEARPGSDPDR